MSSGCLEKQQKYRRNNENQPLQNLENEPGPENKLKNRLSNDQTLARRQGCAGLARAATVTPSFPHSSPAGGQQT